MNRRLMLRNLWSGFMVLVTALCSGTVVAILAIVVFYVIQKGAGALHPSFFFHLPTPEGVPGGGLANAIVGSIEIVALASLAGVPVGVLAGIYCAIFGRGRLANAVRFLSDVLTGMPSIAIGVFAYALVVLRTKHFSAVSASVALAIIMLPIILRTTEEAVRLVPLAIREGALALGIPNWKATLLVTLPVARPGIITGVLLSVARVSGESAPLLFTALGSEYWTKTIFEPTAALPLEIFKYAISPYKDQNQMAWGGALVLIALVFALNLVTRTVFARRVAAK